MKQLILFILILFLCGCDKDTTPPLTPTIITGNVSNVMNITATVSISITDVYNSKEVGVLYSSSLIGLSSADAQKWSTENFKSGENTVSLTGLMPGTTYYYKAYATDGYASIYGEMKTFTTGIDYAILITNNVSGITSNKAICGGTISNSGGGTINTRGVCWSTSSDPTINLTTKTVDGKGVGSFSSLVTGLTAKTIYYVRAYATNEKGTAYGIERTFTTLPISIPTLTTTSISSITTSTAICGGNITDDGGATVTARGVCWSTTSNPTITDSKTTDGTEAGAFTSSISGLTANTTYYVRAYATNEKGTAYGNLSDFKSLAEITDVDGNVYHAITIGTQTWMVENLKTTKYNDGTSIPLVTNDNTWSVTNRVESPFYCWYDNNIVNKNTYGALYNWFAVNTGKLAPTGWHIATDAEWATLINYLGGESIAGGKLKETGTTHWNSPNIGATNESGFTALPGGIRYFNDGTFGIVGILGSQGNWWSSTEYNATFGNYTSWNWFLSNDENKVYRVYNNKHSGYSVRCLRNK